MRFLPVVERELRAAARQPRTYRFRLAAAAMTVLVLVWMVLVLGWRGQFGGRDIFQFLSWIAFLYCLIAGVTLTADSLSAEKRESTIGLLFLTDLKGYDIVLGKLLATSLTCAFGLLAMFPVLAIPLIMGGVQLAEFWREAVHLANTLFLSISVGLCVSTISRHSLRATVGAILMMSFFAFGIPGIIEIARNNGSGSRWCGVAEIASPFYAHVNALHTGLWKTSYFWSSLLVNHLIALLFLGLACGFLPHAWREGPGRSGLWRWREVWRRWHFGSEQTRSRFRTRLLEWNPFFWVSSRERVSSSGFILFGMAATLLAIWISSELISSSSGRSAGVEVVALTWFWTCLALQVAMLFKIAWGASQRFSEDRESGALELLLATPFPVRRILRGQWMALLRQMAGPILLLIAMHALLLWGVLMLYHVESGKEVTVWQILRAIFRRLDSRNLGVDWEVAFAARITLAIGAVILIHWFTLGWVAMWVGLRSKHVRWIPWTSIALVLVPPWPLFTLAVFFFAQFWFLWNETVLIMLVLKTAVALNLLNDLILVAWAWTKLRREFRLAATERYQPKRKRRPWVMIRRAAIGAVTVAVVVLLFYVEEDWRGQRAWHSVQREAAARGESLDLASIIPPGVPADQNFGAAPVFAPLFAPDGGPAAWKIPQTKAQALQLLSLSVLKTNNVTGAELNALWQTGQNIDLVAWQKAFTPVTRTTASGTQASASQMNRIGTVVTAPPSDTILNVLQAFDAVLEEVETASPRPFSRFPIRYDGSGVWLGNLAHLPVLHNLGQTLCLRSVAKLAAGKTTEAFHDLQLIFYLADSVRTEPVFRSHSERHSLLDLALQPVWEGLAKHAWSEGQLAWIEQRCRQDVLAEFQIAMRGEMILQIQIWRSILSMDTKAPHPPVPVSERSWRLFKRIYPRGWIFQNQVRTCRFYEMMVSPAIDSKAARVFPERVEQLAAAAERGNAPGWQRMGRGISGDVPWSFAHTQTSLDQAVLACALERYWRDHQRYPESLAALSTQYVKQLPRDVITGGPLKYRRIHENWFQLYSVGMNQIDDRGISNNELDWVWSYEFKPERKEAN